MATETEVHEPLLTKELLEQCPTPKDFDSSKTVQLSPDQFDFIFNKARLLIKQVFTYHDKVGTPASFIYSSEGNTI